MVSLEIHREDVKTQDNRDVILYMSPYVSLIVFLSLVFSLRYLVSQLLKAQGWFGERIFESLGISNHVVYIIMESSFSLTLQGLKILCYTSLCNTRKVPQENKCLLFHSPCIWCFIPSGTTCLPKDCLTTVWQFPNGKKMLGFIQRKGGAFWSFVFNLG